MSCRATWLLTFGLLFLGAEIWPAKPSPIMTSFQNHHYRFAADVTLRPALRNRLAYNCLRSSPQNFGLPLNCRYPDIGLPSLLERLGKGILISQGNELRRNHRGTFGRRVIAVARDLNSYEFYLRARRNCESSPDLPIGDQPRGASSYFHDPGTLVDAFGRRG
jgi:hypothetical protein